MRYVLDGYNLLFALGWLLRGDQPGRRRWAREKLLHHLHSAPGVEPGTVTVVFDAGEARHVAASDDRTNGVRVLFAVEQNADDLIEELIRHEPRPRQLTVVSNDHRLHHAARHRHCPILSCLDYFEQISRPPPPADTSEPAQDDDAGKPETVDRAEVQGWLRTFGDIDDKE
jgi:predicted RNA-binding protein with PIN domain